MNQIIKTLCLGDEYDDELITRLRELLKSEGAVLKEKLEGLAGSQEVHLYDFLIRGFDVKIEIETYMGVTIIGPTEIVDDFAMRLGKRSE